MSTRPCPACTDRIVDEVAHESAEPTPFAAHGCTTGSPSTADVDTAAIERQQLLEHVSRDLAQLDGVGRAGRGRARRARGAVAACRSPRCRRGRRRRAGGDRARRTGFVARTRAQPRRQCDPVHAAQWPRRHRTRLLVQGTSAARLVVVDTGPGIASDERDRVFDGFTVRPVRRRRQRHRACARAVHRVPSRCPGAPSRRDGTATGCAPKCCFQGLKHHLRLSRQACRRAVDVAGVSHFPADWRSAIVSAMKSLMGHPSWLPRSVQRHLRCPREPCTSIRLNMRRRPRRPPDRWSRLRHRRRRETQRATAPVVPAAALPDFRGLVQTYGPAVVNVSVRGTVKTGCTHGAAARHGREQPVVPLLRACRCSRTAACRCAARARASS